MRELRDACQEENVFSLKPTGRDHRAVQVAPGRVRKWSARVVVACVNADLIERVSYDDRWDRLRAIDTAPVAEEAAS